MTHGLLSVSRPVPKRTGSITLSSASRQPPKLGVVLAEHIPASFKEAITHIT